MSVRLNLQVSPRDGKACNTVKPGYWYGKREKSKKIISKIILLNLKKKLNSDELSCNAIVMRWSHVIAKPFEGEAWTQPLVAKFPAPVLFYRFSHNIIQYDCSLVFRCCYGFSLVPPPPVLPPVFPATTAGHHCVWDEHNIVTTIKINTWHDTLRKSVNWSRTFIVHSRSRPNVKLFRHHPAKQVHVYRTNKPSKLYTHHSNFTRQCNLQFSPCACAHTDVYKLSSINITD